MAVEIKNEQLRYCVDRLNAMECKTDGDLIFQGQCLSAIWDKIHKVQPELDTTQSFEITVKLTDDGLFVENMIKLREFAEVPNGEGCSFMVENRPTIVMVVNERTK